MIALTLPLIDRGRSAELQRLGVGLVAVHVLEEDAVAAADGPFSVAKRIVRKAEPRARIHTLVLHTSGGGRRNPWNGGIGDTALHQTVEDALAGSDVQEL